jgi:hypothetical protein
MPDRLWFTKDGKDILEGIELRNGKANPFGWSQHEVWLVEFGGETMVEHCIGGLDCGVPFGMADGYGFRIERETKPRQR